VFGIEETAVGDKVLFVISSQRIGARRLVGEHGAKVSSAHAFLREFAPFSVKRLESLAEVWRNYGEKASR